MQAGSASRTDAEKLAVHSPTSLSSPPACGTSAHSSQWAFSVPLSSPRHSAVLLPSPQLRIYSLEVLAQFSVGVSGNLLSSLFCLRLVQASASTALTLVTLWPLIPHFKKISSRLNFPLAPSASNRPVLVSNLMQMSASWLSPAPQSAGSFPSFSGYRQMTPTPSHIWGGVLHPAVISSFLPFLNP